MNVRAVIVRRTSVVEGGLVVEVTEEGPYYVQMTRPSSSGSGGVDPRDLPAWDARWRSGLLGPQGDPLHTGAQFSTLAGLYELLTEPKEVISGSRLIGYSADAQLVDILYPYTAVLREQNNTFVGNVRWAFWGGSESHESTGDYETFSAAVPPGVEVERNQSLTTGSSIYRIMAVESKPELARTELTVRRNDG